MKIQLLIIVGAIVLSSCGVQQFHVNSNYSGVSNPLFGENTFRKECIKSGDVFIFGINTTNQDTQEMANLMNADSYTIETKYNVVSVILPSLTFGIIGYKRITVFKR